jgi:hypothetical protein
MSFPFYKYFQIIPKIELYNLAIHPENGISKYMKCSKRGHLSSNDNLIHTLLNVFQINTICGFYGAMRSVTLWMDNRVIPIIRQIIQNKKAPKIQRFIKNYQCRKKIRDIREFRHLSSENKVRMAFYATMYDSRSLMGLSYEEKMQIPTIVWVLGIVKDGRVYRYLPEEIKNNPNPDIGVFFAKILIDCGDWYPSFIPPHIRSIIQ